jgi:hypothetical protein
VVSPGWGCNALTDWGEPPSIKLSPKEHLLYFIAVVPIKSCFFLVQSTNSVSVLKTLRTTGDVPTKKGVGEVARRPADGAGGETGMVMFLWQSEDHIGHHAKSP